MIRKFLFVTIATSLALSIPVDDAWARGGGGMRGGGGLGGGGMRGGGGMGGGGFNGGMHGGMGGGMGGMGGGGMRGPGGMGGMGGPGGMGGGFSGGGMGGNRGGMGGPGAAGMGGGRVGGVGGVGGPGAAGLGGGRVGGVGGPGAAGLGGGRVGGPGGLGEAGRPSRGDLNNFLGLPGDEGMHGPGSLGVGAGNIGVGSDLGIGGGRPGYGVGGVGRPGVGVGGVGRPGVGVGGVGAYRPVSAAARYSTAAAIRGNYNHWGLYGRDWYGRYPGAWLAAGWATGAMWNACAWDSAAAYCGYGDSEPMYYDYGNNVTYTDNSVYYNGQSLGTTQEYYDQASSIASTGAAAQAPADGDWLPLGVFSLTKPDEAKSDVSVQLAVNKEGVIRGNYTDTKTNKNQLVQGSVDKKTQRVAFTVGDNTKNVIETGLYNLTKDEAPCLIHFGNDRSEQWLLVRLEKPSDDTDPLKN